MTNRPMAEVIGSRRKELGMTQKDLSEKLNITDKAAPMAMGIAVTVTSVLGELDICSGFSILGIGLVCLAIRELKK